MTMQYQCRNLDTYLGKNKKNQNRPTQHAALTKLQKQFEKGQFFKNDAEIGHLLAKQNKLNLNLTSHIIQKLNQTDHGLKCKATTFWKNYIGEKSPESTGK